MSENRKSHEWVIECKHERTIPSGTYPGQNECADCGVLEQFYPFIPARPAHHDRDG